MDTSKKYIEMCRAANEIQKMWLPTLGDFFEPLGDHLHDAVWVLSDFGDLEYAGANGEYQKGEHPETWLPRQDQLQEMITNDEYLYRTEFGKSSGALFEAITEFAHRGDCGKSFEMLWLIFIMERKFKKFWNGVSWRALP